MLINLGNNGAVLAILVIGGGIVSYFAIPEFKKAVDDFLNEHGFKSTENTTQPKNMAEVIEAIKKHPNMKCFKNKDGFTRCSWCNKYTNAQSVPTDLCGTSIAITQGSQVNTVINHARQAYLYNVEQLRKAGQAKATSAYYIRL